MIKIQLALDRLSKEECFQVINETENYIDLIEIGTGLIKEYGVSIIKDIKYNYPEKILVADMKTCDAGEHEAKQAFNAGADITTVMAFSSAKTIVDSIHVANSYNKKVMVDLLGVNDKILIKRLEDLGVDFVGLHFGKDMQQSGDLSNSLFSLISDSPQLITAIAGGINMQVLPDLAQYKPDIIIVGSYITKANNSTKVASSMKGWLDKFESDHQQDC